MGFTIRLRRIHFFVSLGIELQKFDIKKLIHNRGLKK